MKIKPLIKPIGTGVAIYAFSRFTMPQYSDIVAVGAGLYILYKFISTEDHVPLAIGIRFDKQIGKMVADIKNPSKKTFAFITHIRLKETPIQAEGMMAGSIESNRTTLIAETPAPTIIGPNETLTIYADLLIPQEMYESSDGTLQVSLNFEDVPSAIAKSAAQKIDEGIKKIETKMEISPPVVTKLDTADIISKDIKIAEEINAEIQTLTPESMLPETVMPQISKDTIPQKIEPPEGIPKLPTPQEFMDFLENDTVISIVPENMHKADEIIKNFKEEDILTDSLQTVSKPFNKKRPGKDIGHSQSMLAIIAAIDRLKSINVGNDAI